MARASSGTHDRQGALSRSYMAALVGQGVFAGKPEEVQECLPVYLRSLSCLAEDCASTAFVVHMHYSACVFVDSLAPGLLTTPTGHEGPGKALVLSSMNSEPGMHYRRTAVRVSRALADGHRTRVKATKHFCSGVSHADMAFSLVGDPEAGRTVAVLLPLDSDGISVGDSYDLLGLRATDSRTVSIDASIPSSLVLGPPAAIPTELWSLGYAAIAQGIGRATVAALHDNRDSFVADGRWGEWEEHRLGALVQAQSVSEATLSAAAGQRLSEGDGRLAITAKAEAGTFAQVATRQALSLVGGESALWSSAWSRRFRDAVTLGLLPPSLARVQALLAADGTADIVSTAPARRGEIT